MSYRNTALFLAIFTAFVCSIHAQNKPDASKPANDQSRFEQLEKSDRDAFETLRVGMTGTEFIDLDFFLPAARDAWTVSVSAHGGFAGGNRLIAAINSNGNYLCHPRSFNAAANIVPTDAFEQISRLVNSEKFIYNAQAVYSEPGVPFCSDCSVEILTITRKTKKLVIKDQYAVSGLAQSAPKLWEIYEKVVNSAACR